MTTPCCIRAVGSICFEERLQEDGKCCLCQVYPYKSDSQSLEVPSDDTFDYKVHFIPATWQDEINHKAEVEAASTAEDGRKFSKCEDVVSSKSLESFSPDLKHFAQNTQFKTLDPWTQFSTTIDAAPLKPQFSANLDERKYQIDEQVDHLGTKIHKLKLFDRGVICHLRDIHEKNLLSLIQYALKDHVHHTACNGFFQRAQVVQGRYVDLSICLTCSQDPDLMNGPKDWHLAFQSFVLTTQLRRYKVSVGHIQVETMSIVGGIERSKTIQKLLDDNASVFKSFTSPAAVGDIHWNMSVINLKPRDYASITVAFSTA